MTSQTIAQTMLQISIPRMASRSSRCSGNSMVRTMIARRANARDQRLGDHRVAAQLPGVEGFLLHSTFQAAQRTAAHSKADRHSDVQHREGLEPVQLVFHRPLFGGWLA